LRNWGSYHIAAKTAILVKLNQKHPKCSDRAPFICRKRAY
jgi:hypothetical protein